MSSPDAEASTPPVPARLRRARIGVFGIFFALGVGTAAWLVSIPAVQARTGISHGTLGGLLLVLGLGAVIGMQIAGYAITRWGSRVVTGVSVGLTVLAVNLPVHAPSAITLGAALLALGLTTGAVDVAMNDQAVIVERGYRRPIMAAFHAFWSIGAAAGALLGAVIQGLSHSVDIAVLVSSVLIALIAAGSVRLLLPASESLEKTPAVPVAPTAQESERVQLPQPSVRGRLIGFGVLAFLLMLAEGVANDWSALHAVEHLGQPGSTAALAYATYAVAMNVGRLCVDRVAGRFGPAFVVRYGSLTAAVGITLVMISPWFWLTLAGWAVYGLGLAGLIPQLFTAAGNIGAVDQSIVLSRVVGAGYVGQLAGPALVGFAANWVGLNLAFVVPLVFCVVAVVVAPIVSSPGSRRAGTVTRS